jgi:hypothetical protein
MPSRHAANQNDREPFVKGKIPSLIVEEFPFNKYHWDSLPIKSIERL